MIHANIPWGQFKQFCDTRKLDMLYLQYDDSYVLGAADASFQVECLLFRDAGQDVLEFENVYKAKANPEKIEKVAQELHSFDSRLRILDMNVLNGGVCTNAIISSAWTSLYSYQGSGYLLSFLINLSTSSGFKIRLIIDDQDLYNDSKGLSITSINSATKYNLQNIVDYKCGFVSWSNGLAFKPSLPLQYNQSLKILLARESGNGNFLAGLVELIKN